jgi:hypothetical protein
MQRAKGERLQFFGAIQRASSGDGGSVAANGDAVTPWGRTENTTVTEARTRDDGERCDADPVVHR